MSAELEKELRDGLVGVTPGPYTTQGRFVYATGSVDTWSGPVMGVIASFEETSQSDGEGRNWTAFGDAEKNSAHMARCSPENIATLLDTITALRAEAAEAREAKARADALEEATKAGWNACRKSIYAVCEDVQNEADRLQASTGPYGATEDAHAKGYFSGQRYAAKSIARGFCAMNAEDDDHLATAIRALSPLGEQKP